MSQEFQARIAQTEVTRARLKKRHSLSAPRRSSGVAIFAVRSNPSPYEYTCTVNDENRPLAKTWHRSWPIAEQTWRVAGSQQMAADARGNVDDLLTLGVDYLAGIGQEFLMFLDEGSLESVVVACLLRAGRTLSSYSQASGRFTILPLFMPAG